MLLHDGRVYVWNITAHCLICLVLGIMRRIVPVARRTGRGRFWVGEYQRGGRGVGVRLGLGRRWHGHEHFSARAAPFQSYHSRSMAYVGTGMLVAAGLSSVLGTECTATAVPEDGPPNSSGGSAANFNPNVFVDAIDKALPGLVNIQIYAKTSPFANSTQMLGTGSGFIISEDGFIITNNHVVEGAARFSSNARAFIVQLSDGRKYEASVHSTDPVSDLALLQIHNPQGEKFPTMRLGSSAKLRHGEWVIALGSPSGLQNTATHGIVSSTVRHSSELGMKSEHEEYIQTDAAINPGNSGGPLINLNGEVIGINRMTLVGVPSGGVGFAIPIDTAWSIIKQLRKTKRVVRPFVGMKFIALTPDIVRREMKWSKTFPQHVQAGILILQVLPRSPADRCGLQPGDVLTHFEGQPIKSTKDFHDHLHTSIPAKKQVRITIRRGDKQPQDLVLKPEIKSS